MWIIYLNCNFFQHTNYSLYCICFIIFLELFFFDCCCQYSQSMFVALAYNIYKSCTFTKQYKTVTSKILTVFYK